MMTLYCLRHGEAMSALDNPKRPLSPEGAKAIDTLGHWLAERSMIFPQIVHSGIMRAAQTATRIAAATCPQTTLMTRPDLLAEQGNVEMVRDWIATQSEITLLVGHLPLIAELVSALVGGPSHYQPIVNFSPGTLVCLQYLQAQRWVIDWVMTPSLFDLS